MAAECFGPRGDEKNGCREECLAFCSMKGVKSKFTSFRSNRFNNLFVNASAIIFHKDHIKTFLDEYVSHNNLKLKSIVSDLNDTIILSNVSVLSFFHLFFTDPYWKLMESTKPYSEFPTYVKLMAETLDLWSTNEFNPLMAASVFF